MSPSFLKPYKEILDQGLIDHWLKKEEPSLKDFYEAVSYSLHNPFSKRLRGALILICTEALGERGDKTLPFALAVELAHTYSLIHDDLPALDDGQMRRKKTCLHKEKGEGVAILAGNYLLTEAYSMLSFYKEEEYTYLVQNFTHAISEMIEGQYLDIKNSVSSFNQLGKIYEMKTGALFEASFKVSFLLSGSKKEKQAGLFGRKFGYFFQLIDDYLDEKEEGLNALNFLDKKQLERLILEEKQALLDLLKRFKFQNSLIEKLIELNGNRLYG